MAAISLTGRDREFLAALLEAESPSRFLESAIAVEILSDEGRTQAIADATGADDALSPIVERAEHVRSYVVAIGQLRVLATFAEFADLVWNGSLINSGELSRLLTTLAAQHPERFSDPRQKLLAMQAEARRRIDAVNAYNSGSAREVDTTALALAPDTVLFFAARIRQDALMGDVAAEEAARALERLETESYNFHVSKVAKVSGQRPAYRVKTSGMTELWWLTAGVDPQVLLQEATSVLNGAQSFEDGIRAVQASARATLEEMRTSYGQGGSRNPPHNRSFHLTLATGAFCVVCSIVIGTVHQARRSATLFQNLIGVSPWWADLSGVERGAVVFKVAIFILQNLPVLEQPATLLREVVGWLSTAIEQLPSEGHAGLQRDLRTTRARLLREHAQWVAADAVEAVHEFERGLNVFGARFDREARGRALGDYASALAALPAEGRPSLDAIDKVYREALFWLPSSEFPSSRSVVLLMRGILHNEAVVGTHEHNQEYALRYLLEARECLAGLDEAEPDVLPFHRELRASVFLALGNVIRARGYGSPSTGETALNVDLGIIPRAWDPVVGAAVLQYREGLRVLGDTGHEYLRGVLHMGIGFAHLEDAGRSSSGSDARAELEVARRWLTAIELPHSLATIAWYESLVADRATVDTPAGLLELERCEAVCRRYGHLEGTGKAALRRAELRLLAGERSPAQLQGADRALEVASDSFASAGLLALHRQVLELRSRVCWAWSERSRDPERRRYLHERAITCLTAALAFVDLGVRQVPLRHRMAAHQRRMAVAQDLAWLRLKLGESVGDVSAVLHAAATLDTPVQKQEGVTNGSGQDALLSERELWMSGTSRSLTADVAEEVQRLELALDEARRRELVAALRGSRAEVVPPAVEGLGDGSVHIQLVISEWGGLAVVRMSEAPDIAHQVELKLDRSILRRWLWGDGQDGWIPTSLRRPRDADELAEFHRVLEQVVQEAAASIWIPILAQCPDALRNRSIFVAPGACASIPLHLATVDGVRVVQAVRGFAYLVTPLLSRVVPREVREVLITLSDPTPVGTTAPTLPNAIGEVVGVAACVRAAGRSVTIAAVSGREFAEAVFKGAIPDGVMVSQDRPTPNRIGTALSSCDLFFYSGHGEGSSRIGGRLILVDEAGEPDGFDLFVARVGDQMRGGAGVMLSACETAVDAVSGAGVLNMSTTFLERGAAYVLASMWRVLDAYAPDFSTPFAQLVIGGVKPEEACVQVAKQLSQAGLPVRAWGPFCVWVSSGASSPQMQGVTASQAPP